MESKSGRGKNIQVYYDDYGDAWWDGSQRGLRTLANQVQARLVYFDRVAPRWEGMTVLDLGCGGGFQQVPSTFTGMGPVGINRRLDFVFGLLPFTWVMYLGHAR